VTHGTNQDQRLVNLDPVTVPGGIQVTIPSSSNKLPPGHYMLFVLNNGVPSISSIIRVQNIFAVPVLLAVACGVAGGQHQKPATPTVDVEIDGAGKLKIPDLDVQD
jgi:hypothetical protein